MWILVDYSNLPPMIRRAGLRQVVAKIIDSIDGNELPSERPVVVRLYGGWYEGETLSHLAQDITAEISADFPRPYIIGDTNGSRRVRVEVQLARSMVSEPRLNMLHTYRLRGFPGGLRCSPPPYDGCGSVDACPIHHLHTFLTDRCCPKDGCELRPKKIISRAEQKLVDTMLTADLIDLALRGEIVAVVSSDDDMWPGIRLSLSRGAKVLHIHAKPGQSTPPEYKMGVGDNYVQLRIEP